MNKATIFLAGALLMAGAFAATGKGEPTAAKKKRLLVVTHTEGFRHSSIPDAEKTLAMLGEKTGKWEVAYCRNADDVKAMLTPQGLKGFDGVVFANTTGELPIPDKKAFYDWIKSGKAFIGMHSAGDTFHTTETIDNREFNELIGGEFQGHHSQCEISAHNDDPGHPATKALGPTYTVTDEIYLYKNFLPERVHLLLSLDTHPPDGSPEGNRKEPGLYPIAWCRDYGKGRSFYTALGHREDVWASEAYQQHITGGILWALGLEKGSGKPQKKPFSQSASQPIRR